MLFIIWKAYFITKDVGTTILGIDAFHLVEMLCVSLFVIVLLYLFTFVAVQIIRKPVICNVSCVIDVVFLVIVLKL